MKLSKKYIIENYILKSNIKILLEKSNNVQKIVTAKDFDVIYNQVSLGLSFFYTKINGKQFVIDDHVLKEFTDNDRQAIWVDKDRRGFRLAHGSTSYYIEPGQLIEIQY